MTSKNDTDLSWDIPISLINNPFIFRGTIQLCLVTWIVITILFGLIFITTGEFDVFLNLMKYMTLVILGLFIFMLLVMILFFGNRMQMRFSINQRGIAYELLSKRSKVANRLLIILGLFAGKPGAVGAGMVATSQESQFFEWERFYFARYDEKRKTITLRNRWRSLLMVFCLPHNYAEVAETVQEKLLQQAGAEQRRKNPLFSLLLRTALTLLACLPLFLFDYPFEVNLLIPIFIVCFAMATIWLIPLFGYVVIAAVLFLAGLIIFQGLQVHTSQFSTLGNYRGFAILDGGEWAFLALVFVAMLYLVWSSWRAVKGKDISALFLD